jgi:RNA-binding protein Luc7-like 2
MDLGECPRTHDLALRADYQLAANSKDYFYDVDVSFATVLMI